MATYTIEIELDLSADVEGPDHGVGMDSTVENIEIDYINALRCERKDGRFSWSKFDLLKGVDKTSETYNQIIANILEFIGDDADGLLIEEANQ